VYSSFRIELHSQTNKKFSKFDVRGSDLFRFIHFGDNITFHVLRDSPVILSASDSDSASAKYLTFDMSTSVTPSCIFQLVHPEEDEHNAGNYEHQHLVLGADAFMLRVVTDSSSQESYLGLLMDQKPSRVGVVTDKKHALVLTFGNAGMRMQMFVLGMGLWTVCCDVVINNNNT